MQNEYRAHCVPQEGGSRHVEGCWGFSIFSNYRFGTFRFWNSKMGTFQFGNLQFSKLQFPNCQFLSFHIWKLSNIRIPNCHKSKFHNTLNSSVNRPSKKFRMSESLIWKIIVFKAASIFSCIFLNILMINTGPDGSIFGNIFGRSKHVQKNIAIDQETLISHFWTIKNP